MDTPLRDSPRMATLSVAADCQVILHQRQRAVFSNREKPQRHSVDGEPGGGRWSVLSAGRQGLQLPNQCGIDNPPL